MAGNAGKFIDRNPIICPAGKVFGDPAETVARCLKEYTTEDKMQALRHDVFDFDRRKCFPYSLPLLENTRTAGCYNKVRALIRPDDKTNFQELIDEMKSGSYHSYWTKDIGRGRDKVPYLPLGMDDKTTTFGIPSKEEYPLGKIVNPPIPYCQVFRDAEVGHENYIKSHNSYNPGEQCDRKYDCHGYDPSVTFGQPSNVDYSGGSMKRALHMINDGHLIIADSKRADLNKKTRFQIGEVLSPNNNIESVPPGHTFGKYRKRDLYSVGDLMRNCEPNMLKKQLHDWMSHANKVRLLLKEHEFDFYQFYDALKFADENNSKWLPKDVVYTICKLYNVNFDRCLIEPLLELTGILMKECVEYGKFVDILHWRKEFQDLPLIKDIPPEIHCYETSTASAFVQDPKILDNSKLPVAGIASLRADQASPGVDPIRGCKAHYEHLGSESTNRSHLNPSIYTQYDLTHRDFFKVRPKEQIKGLFTKIMNIKDEHFEFIYEEACKQDGGETCVETVRNLIKHYFKI